jgi:hypothetical protein
MALKHPEGPKTPDLAESGPVDDRHSASWLVR